MAGHYAFETETYPPRYLLHGARADTPLFPRAAADTSALKNRLATPCQSQRGRSNMKTGRKFSTFDTCSTLRVFCFFLFDFII